MHSQRMNDTPLRPWLIAEKGGKIISAHCDCMAGLGEACTHIAATLFWVDATVRIRETKTVTQEKAYWMLPTGVKKIAYSQLSDIDFTSAKSKKVLLDKHINNEKVKTVQRNVTVSTPTPDELDSFFKELSMAGSKPAILSLIPQYSDQYIPAPLSKQFPAVLTDLCNHDSFNLEFDDLKHKCDNIKVTVNEEEAQNVFEATKLQSKSKMWFRFRAGRITASKMKEVCRTNLAKPSESLIKSVCYPGENKFTNAATQWGCDHEKSAINEYLKTMSEAHDNIQVNESGLILNPAHPHLGASPDGLVVCDCCGEGCIEVKCPYCIRDCKLDETVVIKTCLKESDGTFQLNRAHKYYYQVQTQLLLSDNDYVDFVLWTMKGLHIEPDADVFAEIIAKSKEFFQIGVLPELVGKFYSFESPASV